MKPIVLRPAAARDVRERVRHYRGEGGSRLALRLVAELTAARRQLERQPGIGSPRLGVELELAGLRTLRVGGFPLLLVYLEHEDYVEVERLLHERQDMAALVSQLLAGEA